MREREPLVAVSGRLQEARVRDVSDDSQDTLVKAFAHGPTVLEKSVFVCVPP
jgi:hypothetical protein